MMVDGTIHRSPAEVAEYLATHRDARMDAHARIIPANSVRARLTSEQQDRVDHIISGDAGTYDLEQLRQRRTQAP